MLFRSKRSILGVSTPRAKYRRRGHRGDPPVSQKGPWRGPGCGRATCPPSCLVMAPLPFFGDSGSFYCADFLYIFPGIFGAILMAGKPEMQKQQKTETGNWVHRVNRLVQIGSKCIKVQSKHGKVTQNMHGASRNYRYVWDVSVPTLTSHELVWLPTR